MYQAVVILWTRLDQMFSPQWRNANGELGGDNFNYLCELLVLKTPSDIQAGIEKIEKGGSEFKPTLPEIRKMCFVGNKSPSHNMIGVDFELPDHSKQQSKPEVFSSHIQKVRDKLKFKQRSQKGAA